MHCHLKWIIAMKHCRMPNALGDFNVYHNNNWLKFSTQTKNVNQEAVKVVISTLFYLTSVFPEIWRKIRYFLESMEQSLLCESSVKFSKTRRLTSNPSSKLIYERQNDFSTERSKGDLLSYVSRICINQWMHCNSGHIQGVGWTSWTIYRVMDYHICYAIGYKTSCLDTQSNVVTDGISSKTHLVHVDVSQESVLSETLFLLNINVLLSVTSNPICNFAGISTLISSFSSTCPFPHRSEEVKILPVYQQVPRNFLCWALEI